MPSPDRFLPLYQIDPPPTRAEKRRLPADLVRLNTLALLLIAILTPALAYVGGRLINDFLDERYRPPGEIIYYSRGPAVWIAYVTAAMLGVLISALLASPMLRLLYGNRRVDLVRWLEERKKGRGGSRLKFALACLLFFAATIGMASFLREQLVLTPHAFSFNSKVFTVTQKAGDLEAVYLAETWKIPGGRRYGRRRTPTKGPYVLLAFKDGTAWHLADFIDKGDDAVEKAELFSKTFDVPLRRIELLNDLAYDYR